MTSCPKLTAGWNHRRSRKSRGTNGPTAAMAAIPNAALLPSMAKIVPPVRATMIVELAIN